MKRASAIFVPAVVLAAVVIPWVVVPIFVSDPEVKNYSIEELTLELKNRSLFDGDLESLSEVPELWQQFSNKINQLTEEEKQSVLGEFVESSVERLDDKRGGQVELLVSLKTLGHIGSGFKRLEVQILFLDGKLESIEHDDTSFAAGLYNHGSYCELGVRIDLSRIDRKPLPGCKIILTSEMTLGGSPELSYQWRAEYELE